MAILVSRTLTTVGFPSFTVSYLCRIWLGNVLATWTLCLIIGSPQRIGVNHLLGEVHIFLFIKSSFSARACASSVSPRKCCNSVFSLLNGQKVCVLLLGAGEGTGGLSIAFRQVSCLSCSTQNPSMLSVPVAYCFYSTCGYPTDKKNDLHGLQMLSYLG